jgi:hypothetical protein
MFRALKRAPLPVVLLIASFLGPTELSLFLAGLRLPLHRVALIVILPFAILKLFKRGTKLKAFDVLFFVFAAWTTIVFMQHSGKDGLVFGGSLALESLGSYLVARAYVRDSATLRATLMTLVSAILVAALFALPETLLGKIFTHDILRSLTGVVYPTGVEQRMHLTRAYGVFDHPIHYGTFCAASLAMLWFAERKTTAKRKRAAGLLAATLLCLGLQAGLIAWDRLSRSIPSRKWVTVAILAGLYIGITLVSNRGPFALIATGLTLDPWTGFYRLQIWENGLVNVGKSPWVGIGLADWDRPAWMVSATVDAFWLVIMMRTGIPALVIVLSAILLIALAAERQKKRMVDRATRKLVTGWQISVIALILVGCTVHYWNVLHAFFFFIVGLGGWAADLSKADRKVKAAKAVRPAAALPSRPAAAPGPLLAPDLVPA